MFTCLATARPRPSINWYHVDNGSQSTLVISVEVNITEMDVGERGAMSTLTLFNAQPDIATEYICEAVSEVTEFDAVSATALLTVHGETMSIRTVECLFVDTNWIIFLSRCQGLITYV